MSTPTTTMTDAAGQSVPIAYVKPYDRLRDRTARRILARWQKAHAVLQRVKVETMADIRALQDAASKDAEKGRLGGDKGNVQFSTFDGLATVRLESRTTLEFDERLREAHRLIRQVADELAKASGQPDIAEIINAAFQTSAVGLLQKSRILALLRLKVRHPVWAQAMDLLRESIFARRGRTYLYVDLKADREAKPVTIPLDIAAIALPDEAAE